MLFLPKIYINVILHNRISIVRRFKKKFENKINELKIDHLMTNAFS